LNGLSGHVHRVIDEGEAVIVKRLGAETIVQDVEARAAENGPFK